MEGSLTTSYQCRSIEYSIVLHQERMIQWPSLIYMCSLWLRNKHLNENRCSEGWQEISVGGIVSFQAVIDIVTYVMCRAFCKSAYGTKTNKTFFVRLLIIRISTIRWNRRVNEPAILLHGKVSYKGSIVSYQSVTVISSSVDLCLFALTLWYKIS